MPEPLEPISAEKLGTLARKIREVSRSGSVLPLNEAWAGTEEEFLMLTSAEDLEDIALIRDGERTYLYSEQHMTRQYAEAAARARCEDLLHAIAETVRSDSAIYPRPTPVAAFSERPFLLRAEDLTAALERLAADGRHPDIRLVSASDGSLFLFSSNHLDPAHAASLAEWLAVGHQNNP